MKSTFKIHPLYYAVALITIFTGHFKDFVIISLIIFVHELGHLTVAIYYKWNIDKIVILPFGGITIFNEYLNKPIKEEFLIAIAGPIYQILFYVIINMLNFNNDIFILYHYVILLFNLLPIYPLDGSKILEVILEKYFSYGFSSKITIIISIVIIFLLCTYIIFYKNLLMLTMFIFLLIKCIEKIKNYKYTYNKFLFERYLYNFNYSNTKIINGININKMMRDKKHIFYYNNMYLTEKDILKDFFDNY